MKIMVTHPGGPQNVRALLTALETAGRLDCFVTTLGWPRTSPLLTNRLARRNYPSLPWSRFRYAPWRELVRQCFGGGTAAIDAVYREVDCKSAHLLASGGSKAQAVHGYDDGALASFEAARPRGITTVFELSAPYWRAMRALAEEEAERNPAWRSALPVLQDSDAKNRRKDREITMADHIVVASEFARQTLDRCPGLSAPIEIVPYGAPAPNLARRKTSESGRLRVLYVGNLNQQKGLSYLLDAVRLVDVELTLVGKVPGAPCLPLREALHAHRHVPPVGHERVLEIMAEHDVLVLPTLFDGFGLVILEAMSQGLPVIATTNCAGPDLISEGVDGFVVPIRDAASIAARLELLAYDRDRLAAMQDAALAKAALWSWDRYAHRMLGLLDLWLA